MSQSRSPDAAELERALESLREECRQKDHFIATLAHELRNPITALRAAVHLQELSEDDAGLRQKTFDIIARQTEHMERLIDDLMDVSRLNRGKVSLDRQITDLTSIVAQLVVDQQKSFEDRGIEISVAFERRPLWVDADVTRLTQVLANLLNNAKTATETGGHINVEVSTDEAQQQGVIAVRDSGVGMEPGEVEHIFDNFSQTDTGAGRSSGLGLGLAIVRGLVDLHDGEVHAHSAGVGLGSTFVVRLPLSDEPDDPSLRESTHDYTRDRQILVVEDDRDVGQLLVQLLEFEGHRVELAYDAEEGLEKLKHMSPDAILCDLHLPGELDGYAFCRAVRVDPRYETVRMVAMTGRGGKQLRERSLNSGFDEHLIKPVDLDELRRALRSSHAHV